MTRSTTATQSFTALLLATGFAVTLGAQYPDQKQPEKKAGSTEKIVTVTGCVREGDTPNSFVLANADLSALERSGSSSSTPPSTAAGTAGTTAASGTIQLISPSVDLKQHVGHKVEVTGTPAVAMDRPSGTAGAPESADPAAKDKDKDKKKLNVQSVKMVSDSCS
jgi:hypothetical protein